jgi:predicted nucleotidyltransferase
MDLANPMQSVIPSGHGAVLSVLARTDVSLSGSRIAELTQPKFSQRRVNDILKQLADSGIALKESRPPAILYRLNHDHVAADGIVMLAQMSGTLVARIRAELDVWSVVPQAAWLFGSAARGAGGERSDIDIFLLLPSGGLESQATDRVWEHQIETLTEKIRSWSGNSCEVVEMDTSELTAAIKRDDRLIRDLREHAVVLAGPDPRALLRKKILR